MMTYFLALLLFAYSPFTIRCMLYMFLKTGDVQAWHVHESFPKINPSDVVRLQIDGDEVEAVQRYYPFAVENNHSVSIISGDNAKYIVEGLKVFYP